MRYSHTQTATTTTTEQIAQSIHQCLGRLLQKRHLDVAAQDDFASVHAMLQAIPLPTDQFELACTRLRNAQHYLRYTEPGPAWYELRLVATSLSNLLGQVREPRRRVRR